MYRKFSTLFSLGFQILRGHSVGYVEYAHSCVLMVMGDPFWQLRQCQQHNPVCKNVKWHQWKRCPVACRRALGSGVKCRVGCYQSSAFVRFLLLDSCYGPGYGVAFLVPALFENLVLLLADSGSYSKTFQYISFLCYSGKSMSLI